MTNLRIKATDQTPKPMEYNRNIDLSQFHNLKNYETLITYSGPFDKFIIFQLGNKIKKLTKERPTISKKIFKIFIELAQNVAYYSAERSQISDEAHTGVGSLVIGDSDDYYVFATGNLVKTKNTGVLQKKCEIINSLDRHALRKFKRDQRNLIPGTNGGAHIGLIMIALITSKQLDIQFTKVDDIYSYFSIAVKIRKKEEDYD